MRFWHRPLYAVFDALNSTGIWMDILSEPQPRAQSLFPDAYNSLRTKPGPLFFSAVKL